MLRVRLTPQAVADLEELHRYISDDLFNPRAAAELVELVFEKIRTLAAFPQTGARLRTDITILKTYRFIPCKNYLVFYRAEEKTVSVIRVLYARRDYLEILDPDKKKDNEDV